MRGPRGPQTINPQRKELMENDFPIVPEDRTTEDGALIPAGTIVVVNDKPKYSYTPPAIRTWDVREPEGEVFEVAMMRVDENIGFTCNCDINRTGQGCWHLSAVGEFIKRTMKK